MNARGGSPPLARDYQPSLPDSAYQLLYLDNDYPALVSLNTGSKERIVVSDAATGRGPQMTAVVGNDMAVDRKRDLAYVSARDDNLRIIYAIDLMTGDRVIVSK